MDTRAACQLALRPMSHPGRRMPSYRRNKAVRVAASLSGTWEKDSAASGSMDETADVFELNFAVRSYSAMLSQRNPICSYPAPTHHEPGHTVVSINHGHESVPQWHMSVTTFQMF